MQKKLKVLMASAEIAPFAKVGGLADVVGSLPPALTKLGVEVRLIMPLYGSVDKKKFKLKKIKSDIEIASGEKNFLINLWEAKLPKTKIITYFIEQTEYFGQKEVYAGNGSEKFLFFSLAILKILPLLNFIPDVIHANDSHTALLPGLIKVSTDPEIKKIKTLFTIHNLEYQGKSEIKILSTGNLSKDSLASLERDALDGDINFMVQGIINADWVNTVSPTYAKEIKTSAFGAGLERVIKNNEKKISGIINGIDTEMFDPAKDKLIKKKFNYKSLNKKAINKLHLQKRLNLVQDKTIPLVGLVSRLVWQKGLELIDEQIASLPCQFVFLGTGQKEYENQLKKLAKKYPDKISSNIFFDLELAEQIYAGSDIFLMPSRFEPCGLGQMIAMRYGTIPLVRATGGLADTVNASVGFKFKELETKALYKTLQKALNVYQEKPEVWKEMQLNGMKKDFSWNNSAKEYLKLYQKIVKE